MSQADRDRPRRLLLKVVIAIILVIAVIENGELLPLALWMPPFMLFVPTILGLSYFLFVWLRYRLRDDHWALLGTVIAAAVWPWTCFLVCFLSLVYSTERSLPTAEGQYLALLFGPLIPYAILAGVGLCKRG